MSEEDLHVGKGVVIPASDLEQSAARGSGPGGQHVNKTATKVELRFDLEGTRALPPDAKERLRTIAKNRIDADGRIVVESQTSRSQLQNRQDARRKLAELVEQALVRPKKRKPTKPSRGAKRRRLKEKRQHSEKKQRRKTPRHDE